MTIDEHNPEPSGTAVSGTATGDKGVGVRGSGKATGIRGNGETWHGVAGISSSTTGGYGVYGRNDSGGTGVAGASDKWVGVYGSSKGHAGVLGEGKPGAGVIGTSTNWVGVYGETQGMENGPAGVWGEHKGAGLGVRAVSKDGFALLAQSTGNEAVHAETRSSGTAAIAAYNQNPSGTGAAIFAKKDGRVGHAAFLEGNVWISGDLGVGKDITLANADVAEDFDLGCEIEVAEPGTVMILDSEGRLCPCDEAYDTRVAGVVSGAGSFKPGIVLDRHRDRPGRIPIALLGKVWCRVDARLAAIAAGDLLTTSKTPGCAMRAGDTGRLLGAMIGKALAPARAGVTSIPVLVANR